MKRPSIKTMLMTVFAVIAVLFGTASYVSLSSLAKLDASLDAFTNNDIVSISHAKDIQLTSYILQLAYANHGVQQDDVVATAIEKTIADDEKKFAQAVKAYEPYVDSTTERQAYDQISKLLPDYFATGTKLLDFSRQNKMQEIVNTVTNKLNPLGKQISEASDILVQFNQASIDRAASEAKASYASTQVLSYSFLGVSALVIVAAAFFGLFGIARPVQSITGLMTRLADGDTVSVIPYAGRADEIGAMAGAVEVFRLSAIANKQLQADAETNRAQAEADRVRLTAEAEAAAQKRLQEATSGLAAGLKRLAAGDLSFELTEPFAPDFEALRHDLNGAVAQLGETLRSVAQSTGSIDIGTREISQSADDLSKRTEQQAASLEETAAALDQITVNVSNSSKRADEARAVAVQANTGAAQSGKVVANAVDAMQRIEQSSNQISNIIGVIDEIAFQTNLLALNAGVEAARAGDAGRGFAVVAQEVRELAQRSAKAAKEIKDLIGTSTKEVESGVKLVQDTGEALRTIEQYIVTINQHMDSIATSAREQSTGLAEVNTAVNQMDQVTQQNAAMVEETNAASASLANEAGRLRELISQFNLGARGAPDHAAALRKTASAMATSRHLQPVRLVANGGVAKENEWTEF